ncbi:MAG: sulfotransferase [Calditrichaceae bacterium]
MSSPIIVIGAHRSGTSLISRVLESAGVFMGRKKDINNESLFFQNLNQWLLAQSSATWDNPDYIEYLIQNEEILSLNVEYLESLLHSPHMINYLGLMKYLRSFNGKNLKFTWGWKDPRNTFTLPVWLNIFPDAKIIHVYRHGVDVANSLTIREAKIFSESKRLHYNRHSLYKIQKKKGYFTYSIYLSRLNNAFDLWLKYMKAAKRYQGSLGENYFELSYENFLLEPERHLPRLLNFIDQEYQVNHLENIKGMLRKDRVYAYKNDEKLLAFSKTVEDKIRSYYE